MARANAADIDSLLNDTISDISSSKQESSNLNARHVKAFPPSSLETSLDSIADSFVGAVPARPPGSIPVATSHLAATSAAEKDENGMSRSSSLSEGELKMAENALKELQNKMKESTALSDILDGSALQPESLDQLLKAFTECEDPTETLREALDGVQDADLSHLTDEELNKFQDIMRDFGLNDPVIESLFQKDLLQKVAAGDVNDDELIEYILKASSNTEAGPGDRK